MNNLALRKPSTLELMVIGLAVLLAGFALSPVAHAQVATTTPSYCNTSSSSYGVTTDMPSYMQGSNVNFCIGNNSTSSLLLSGTHPWIIADNSGNTVFTPSSTDADMSAGGNGYFTDVWTQGNNGFGSTTSSRAAPGTYQVVFNGLAGSPTSSFFNITATSTGTTTGTGTTTPQLSDLIMQLQNLQTQFPAWGAWISGFINSLLNPGGGSTGGTTSGVAMIDQNGWNVASGGSLDFGGHNFAHEEDVKIWLNGAQVGSAHADGGGNFSTGALMAPSTSGPYTYTFVGSSGDVGSAIIHVQ